MTSTVNPKRTLNIVEIGESHCLKLKKHYHINASSSRVASTYAPALTATEATSADGSADKVCVKMELDRKIPDYVFYRRNAIAGGTLTLPPVKRATN
ncbi:hypothetical protein K7432_012928 [Basidiobolus ranarum]|uniref:Uncharacterized protein n=1 Tax=Basidiobolus ranarum TaxID=34480 RepID=A0ABR2VSF8_9FUNG